MTERGLDLDPAHAITAEARLVQLRRECERQRADIARLTRVLKMQSTINSAMLRIRDRTLLSQEACRIAVDVGRYSSAVVWTVEPGARYARPGFRAGRRMPDVAPDPLLIGVGRERDSSLTGRAMRTGEVTVCCDLTRHDPPVVGRQLLYADGVRSVVALPFVVDGVPVGALTLTSGDSTLVHDDELLLLQELSASLSFAMRSQLQAEAAEAALKHAKETGRKHLHYKREMHSESAERLVLEHRLREAIDAQQFELYYQPQINIVTGRIEALEALLRWNDPDQGVVLPGRFLPVLEASGMIVPVGQWVVQRAVQDCARWRRLGLHPVRVAVNVSAVQFRGRAFVDFILGLVQDWPHDPHGFGIDLEITETALLQDIDGAGRQLRELRAAGIRIALDDFGTGYSSLGLLSRLPVDLLKIDRSFVKGLPNDHTSMTLTRTIIGLASAFGLLTVAEGVETAEQLKLLRLLNCDASQGFLHCPPVPVREIDRLLAEDE
ncbi:MAG: EAL domain-containing protein [Steroidobacteraceae bacterium]|jgi:EAL domain-containing protein (putative c-di-GMP-specific phosphodiesterase class I)